MLESTLNPVARGPFVNRHKSEQAKRMQPLDDQRKIFYKRVMSFLIDGIRSSKQMSGEHPCIPPDVSNFYLDICEGLDTNEISSLVDTPEDIPGCGFFVEHSYQIASLPICYVPDKQTRKIDVLVSFSSCW